MDQIYRYIDDHAQRFVENLQRLCRQPSISAQSVGMTEAAQLVKEMMGGVGLNAKLYPLKEGPPVVFGERQSRSSQLTMVIYNHYDVQPPEPLELWTHPPFSAVIEDGKLYARGAADNKANIVSRLAALEAFLAVNGDVPCNIKFVVEGEEETGSPHFGEFVRQYRAMLGGDGALWEFGGLGYNDVPAVTLGLKGMLYVEFHVKTASRDSHSARAAVVQNPAWRLFQALHTIRDEKGRIKVKGWYDDVRPFTKEELRALQQEPSQEREIKEELGIKGFLNNMKGLKVKQALAGAPTANIAGFYSGYIGPGHKTVLPAEAMAKMDFRMVPDQDPAKLGRLLARHLRQHGFRDIELKIQSENPAARTPLAAPIAQIARETAREVFGKEPVIHVSSAGSGPMHLFTKLLKLPTVAVGCGHTHNNTHAPDENQRLDVFIQGTKWIAAILARFAHQS